MTALLEDEAYYDAYFHTMQQAAEMHQLQEQRILDNLALARTSNPPFVPFLCSIGKLTPGVI